MENISFTEPDTLINPFEFGPFGSRGTYAILGAVIAAAEDAREKLLARAASMLETTPENLETADSVVWIKDNPEKADQMETDHAVAYAFGIRPL